MRTVQWLVQRYFSVDPRTLGALRIALALLLLADLAHRMMFAELWYTNEGLLPNHTALWRPLRERTPSLFWSCAHYEEAVGLMALIGVAYLGLLVGYRTRLFQLLTWIGIVSLQVRVDQLSNGGDFVLAILCGWTLFLPLGRRFSVDAWLARATQPKAPRDDRPFVSLAVLATWVQFALIYLFNAVHKSGESWLEGSAVRDLWYQIRIATPIAVWARDLPLAVSQVFTWTTLFVEGLIPLLIVIPIKQAWCRALAILLVIGLHASISLSANLGVFSYVMMVYSLVLLHPSHWDWAERRLFPRLCATRPCASIGRAMNDFVKRHGPALVDLLAPRSNDIPPSELRRKLCSVGVKTREAAVAALIVVATLQVLKENRIIPAWAKPETGSWHGAAIAYTRLQQGWQMFAPNTPRTDNYLRIDATMASGQHVDPIALAADIPNDPTSRNIPTSALGLPVYFVSYMDRISRDRRHHRPLTEWIQKYHERTGRPQDRIVAFTALRLEHTSPTPPDTAYSATRTHSFLNWREPAPKASGSAAR